MANDRYDHRAPGGRLAGAPEDLTPEVDPKDAPFVSAEMLAYMERRYELTKELAASIMPPSTLDAMIRVSHTQSVVAACLAELKHYRALAAEQTAQSTEHSTSASTATSEHHS